jgi:FkbM family methyltransferase
MEMKRQLARFLLRRYPFYSGYFRVATSPLGRWAQTAAPSGRVVCTRARGGIRLEVLLDDFEGHCIDLLGDWDPRISWICRRVLRPGDTFVDVGANFGLVSLIGARAVGPTGHVHAFEPQPAVAAMLRRSAALNCLTNLTLHEVALSDSDGVLELQVPSGHTGGASLFRKATGPGNSIQVQVRRGAPYFEEHGIDTIRLVKLDVEGHEAAVLEGLTPVFRDRFPAAVLFESNDWFEGLARGLPAEAWPFADLPTVRFLRDQGYRFYAVGRSFLRVNLRRIDAHATGHPPVSDLLAIHEEHAGELAPGLGLDDG